MIKVLNSFKKIILVIGISSSIFLLSFVIFAWTGPPGTPPYCPTEEPGCETPLHTGTAGQSKTGGLLLNTGGASTGLIVEHGNVGIGTTSPVTALHIGGSTMVSLPAISGTVQGTGHRLRIGTATALGSTGVLDIGNVAGGNVWLQVTDRANLASNYNLLLNPNGGNVGIGTTSPSAKLDTIGEGRFETDKGQIRITPTGWRDSNRSSIKILNKSDNPVELDFRAFHGGLEKGWHFSQRNSALNHSMYFYFYDGTNFHHRFSFHTNGNFSAHGSKNFEINHPLEADKKLIHACIEGPEAAVFYRGEGKLTNSKTEIALPYYFEALTREDDRTIQITPKGEEPYMLSYTDIKNGKFTVYGTKDDGNFSWEVKAVRADVDPLEVEVTRKEVNF